MRLPLTLSSTGRWLLAVTVLLGGCGDTPIEPGQTGDFGGTAFDASSGATLSGVTVAVGGKTAQSDAVGQYYFIGVPAGEQTLTASKDGYLQHTVTVGVVAGDTTYINVSLAPARGPLGLTAETSSASGRVHLSWAPRTTVESYNLYWSTSPGVTPASGTRISGIQGTSYDHSGLNPGTKYYYVLAAVTNGVEGPASSEVNATAGNGIVIQVQDPGGLVADTNIQATVSVNSVYQVTSVTATVEDRTTPLVFQSSVSNWHGLVSLTGLPSPQSRTVIFTATDVHGTVATASRSFEHDRKAVITVESPFDGTVVQSSVRLRVTCVDDAPSGCANLRVIAATGEPAPIGQELAAGVSGFDQDISLSLFDGRRVGLVASTTDNAGRESIAGVEVFVDLSAHLTKVAEVTGTGTVIDASTHRLLVLETTSNPERGTLRIQDRGTGQSTEVLTREPLELSDAHLTAHGAVFVARDNAANFIHGYEWRDNVLLDLGAVSAYLVVDGPYFIWSTAGGALHRRNHESGATIDVPGAQQNGFADVGPNGDVVYQNSTGEINRFRGGVATTLAAPDPDPALSNGFPQTDGTNVVFVKGEFAQSAHPKFSIIAVTTSSTETLVPAQEWFRVVPELSYRLNGGWIAFTKPASGGAAQVWGRDPAGTATQISFFSGVSVLEALATDGRVAFTNPARQPFPRRYLWTPGGTATDIGSGWGQSLFIDGQLHVMLGRALLRVD